MNRVKQVVEIIAYYSPYKVRKALNDFVDKKKREASHARYKEIANRTKVSKEEVQNVVDKLEISSCDIMLHTSMVNIGTIEGGKEWIYDCLIRKIDISEHTLLTVALAFAGRNKNYLESNPIFDVRTAPIAMGSINRYIASQPGALRSVHPTHSVVALGKEAIYYVQDHELDDTPFGKHSPFYKLLKNRGKIVLFGATFGNITMTHAIEDLVANDFPLPVYEKKRFKVHCIDREGKDVWVTTPCHNVFSGFNRYMPRFKDKMIEEGVAKVYPIGEASVIVIEAYKLAVFYFNQLLNGKSAYGDIKLTESQINNIKRALAEL